MNPLPVATFYFNRRTLSKLLSLILLIVTFSLSGCGDTNKTAAVKEKNTATETSKDIKQSNTLTANDIAHKYIIVDTHIDVPYRLEEKYEDVSQTTEDGNFDYPRAKKGGLDVLFMSIYLPAKLQKTPGKSKELADHLIDLVEKIATQSPDKFAMAPDTKTLEANFKKGLISFAMGMENGSGLEGKLENLQHFYDRGIRYITLAHSKANNISDSSYDPEKLNHGLSAFGKKLIPEMNRLGVMVDVSHISDEAFYQVMELSQTPVIASHSSARFFTPGFERNMSDEMIKLLAKNGGVIQINFGSTFISQKSADDYNTFKAARDAFMAKNNVKQDSPEVEVFVKAYREKHPQVFASMDDVIAHFKHVIDLVGVEHVGIGSDFDGVGDSLPIGLKDVSAYPNLIQGLLDIGCSEQDVEKILSGNILRVWKRVENYASEHRQTR